MLLACMIEPEDSITTIDFIKSIFNSTQWNIHVIDTRCKNWIQSLSVSNDAYTIFIIKTSLSDIHALMFENIKFDILILDGSTESFIQNSFSVLKSILSLLKPNAYLIINSDNFDVFNYFSLKHCHIITYGFNNLANLSTSSIGDFLYDSSFMCSLTKTIHSYNGITFEPQEYVFKLPYHSINPYNMLAVAMLAMVSGIDLNSIL
ncbi:MAG: hypothetical protein J6Y29_00610 [Clostridiales bacterium]|nr:hypothetical protein [Clostridiales bacterium]